MLYYVGLTLKNEYDDCNKKLSCNTETNNARINKERIITVARNLD